MPVWGYMGIAMLMGILLSLQPPMNAVLSRATGDPFATAAISIFVAMLGALAVLAVTSRGDLSRVTLIGVPWWIYVAGVIGTIFVAGAVVIVPLTGALVFFVCVVAGQLFGAVIADHFGVLGLAVRTLSAQRLLGLALVLGGVVLVQRG